MGRGCFSRQEYKFIKILDWHKRQLKWFREITGLSDYGVAWISFIKGVVIEWQFIIISYEQYKNRKRLELRPLQESDLEILVEEIGNMNISKYLVHVPFPYSLFNR